MNKYGIIKKDTNEVIHTFTSSNDKTCTQDALQYMLGLGLSITFIKANFKVIAHVSNKGSN